MYVTHGRRIPFVSHVLLLQLSFVGSSFVPSQDQIVARNNSSYRIPYLREDWDLAASNITSIMIKECQRRNIHCIGVGESKCM